MIGRVLCGIVIVLASLTVTPAEGAVDAKPTVRRSLEAFRSDDQLRRYLKYLAAQRTVLHQFKAGAMPVMNAVAAPPAMETVAVTGKRASDSITNNQEAGVDEGDIVKARGDLLIILRRGRLFTVSLAGGGLKPIDTIDAYPPGVDPRGDWYDEMLIAGDRIVVIGYSYGRGGTQVNRFHLDRQGHLSFEDAYALKANDYYSARNYASRLIGTTLIFYSPHYLPWRGDDPVMVLPGLRRWDGGKGAFQPIGTARDVFLSPDLAPREIDTVHSVTRCDLMAPVLACKSVSVLGPSGRVFYVSQTAVYVWVMPRNRQGDKPARSMVYRLPLDGGAPAAIRAHGAPVDQFSFREGRSALDVLVRADSVGEAMWAAERSQGDVALVHISLTAFGDGTDEVAHANYRALPRPNGSYYSFHNRFVGDSVLYGEGNGWGAPKGYVGEVVVASLKGGAPVTLSLPHGVDRIEAMGRDAVVVGSDGANLHFTEVALAKQPQIGGVFVLGGAAQAETRSHGFFYKQDDDDSGVIGLPVSRPSAPAYHQLFREAASVVFVRRAPRTLGLLGELPSRPESARDDACKASCVDWYGNARPIFYGARTFALMGYEIVEGVLRDKDMLEKARVSFTPDPMLIPARN